MSEGRSSFRVKFVGETEADVTAHVHEEDTFQAVMEQVRVTKGWNPGAKTLRLICGGKELHEFDSVRTASSNVVHCIAIDGPPMSHFLDARKPSFGSLHSVEQPPADWLDMVDPGTVLMWIFGSILGLLWLLFVFYAHMFDKTSLVMLVMMTIAFLIPCVLSYMPWLPAFNPSPQAWQPTPGTGYSFAADAMAVGRGNSVQLQGWGRPMCRNQIPPRPRAHIGPGAQI